jgi:hypothetical protein
MHPGDADAPLAIDQRREQDSTAGDGDLPLLGSLQFRVVEPDGGGINDQLWVRGDELFRVMTEVNRRAAFLKLSCLVASDQVGPNHAPAEIEQQMPTRYAVEPDVAVSSKALIWSVVRGTIGAKSKLCSTTFNAKAQRRRTEQKFPKHL